MFDFPDSVELSRLPTPIHELRRTSVALEGARIYIKRDDLTGAVLSGNKIRKLDFLLAEARKTMCDVVITCGGNQSNHARTTAVAAAQLGMKALLFLKNNMTLPFEGNLLLNKMVGADIHYISAEEYARVDALMAEAARDYDKRGLKAYVIPEGGSNALGAMGYVRAAEEIARQLKRMKLKIDSVVVPVGSGGTYAGLLVGKYVFDLPAEIYGVNVCDDKRFFTRKIAGLVEEMLTQFSVPVNFNKQDIRIIDGYVGKGYGLSSQPEIDLIKRVAKSDGIILDPVYTGKAMLGLAEEMKGGVLRENKTILFVHTGGIFGLFPKKTLFY